FDGWSPSPASITPAFTSASLNLPISVSSVSLGMIPASEFFVAFTITITRIGLLLSVATLVGTDPRLHEATNQHGRNRHLEGFSRKREKGSHFTSLRRGHEMTVDIAARFLTLGAERAGGRDDRRFGRGHSLPRLIVLHDEREHLGRLEAVGSIAFGS